MAVLVQIKSVEKSFQVRSEGLGGLVHLGFDHKVAVTLIWVFGKKVLVIFFTHPKLL